jgi:pimeloyl-ACP methyl ester carboxylesterase
MSVVTLDGEIIHYEVLGRGRPLLFLHGWVGSWRYWVPTMQSASMSFRAYALDLWGFGDSAKRPPKYTLENQVMLIDQFMDLLGIARIALVGHGLGSVVALSFAARFPQIVDRLMVSGLPLNQDEINPRLRTATMLELTDWLLGRMPAMDAARSEAPKADPQAIQVNLAELAATNPLAIGQELKTPALYVYGVNDPVVQFPPNDILNLLPEQSHVVTFEPSGHFPMLDDPSKFNRLLADFLALGSGESPRQLQLKEEWKRRVR